MSRISIKLLPRFITLRQSVSRPLFRSQSSGQRTLKTTTNPVSHCVSRFTFVKSSGVFSGRPPFGGATVNSGCSAYKLRNALVRPPFSSAVTLGLNLKHAMRVTGASEELVLVAMLGQKRVKKDVRLTEKKRIVVSRQMDGI